MSGPRVTRFGVPRQTAVAQAKRALLDIHATLTAFQQAEMRTEVRGALGLHLADQLDSLLGIVRPLVNGRSNEHGDTEAEAAPKHAIFDNLDAGPWLQHLVGALAELFHRFDDLVRVEIAVRGPRFKGDWDLSVNPDGHIRSAFVSGNVSQPQPPASFFDPIINLRLKGCDHVGMDPVSASAIYEIVRAGHDSSPSLDGPSSPSVGERAAGDHHHSGESPAATTGVAS